MISTISREAAKRLRPEGAFHLPPAATPLGSSVDLIVENSALQPEVFITDTRRAMGWHFYLDKSEVEGTWTAKLHTPLEPTILNYIFEFHDTNPDAPKQPPLLEIRLPCRDMVLGHLHERARTSSLVLGAVRALCLVRQSQGRNWQTASLLFLGGH